jgi:hypothetical protein
MLEAVVGADVGVLLASRLAMTCDTATASESMFTSPLEALSGPRELAVRTGTYE